MNKNNEFEKNWLNAQELPDSFQILTNIISQRKAIREYNSQKIPSELVEKVIKIACRAPSWYGLEPWFILVISNQKIKQELYPLFQQQKQVLACSHLFLILSYRGEAFNWETDLFKQKVFWKYNRLNEENYVEFYQKSLSLFNPNNPKKISIWAKQQCFILLQNFLLLWTSLNIATSPMGGFQEKEVINYLEKNHLIPFEHYNLAMSFAIGFPLKEDLWKKEVQERDWKKVFRILD
ncbi:nitroreductase family protein [endosymbiont GvMRE of Glomus versiforme]|uniref:nitroreductase family protein n=1 Tax=endosymbiont GvMRE of Glomus versiforme TaxID=2039283 RepID=UPI000ECE884A|nr:nitroreductase family protein [endosymbiont GvMRE of Glomus versiforme]RHZ37621.1 Nitroreductase [endosymbiont GvMRE of Glomus versiforme]